MGGILSKKESKSKSTPNRTGGTITPLDRAILDLKNSRDRLTKYRTKLESDSNKLASRAKQLHAEQKTTYALQLLRLRKHKLQEVNRVEEQLGNVLRMVDTISEKQNEQEVIVAMQRGKDALQILHDQMGIDDVLNLMDEIRDQDEVEKRINEVLSGGDGALQGQKLENMMEEDILMELEQLEEEVRLEMEANIDVKIEGNLPAVPTKPLPEVKKDKVEQKNSKVAVAS